MKVTKQAELMRNFLQRREENQREVSLKFICFVFKTTYRFTLFITIIYITDIYI
jgi:hypothetical protein